MKKILLEILLILSYDRCQGFSKKLMKKVIDYDNRKTSHSIS